jgi:putative ubiquitin-RnfH superfamily antitoxin RatB of RatAB toxin-antitoxin module
MVDVELVYVPFRQKAIQLKLTLPQAATVEDALQQSGLRTQYPEIKDMATGIFAKVVALDTVVKTGDRIEIYRPLLGDPKEKRRQRARR